MGLLDLSALAALRDGIRRTVRASSVVAIAWMVSVAAAIPLAVSVRISLGEQLGASLMADKAAAGADYDWLDEVAAQSSGVAATVRPAVIGFAAVIDNTSDFLDRRAPHPAVATALGVYGLLWTFVSGGIIDRLSRSTDERGHRFIAASGVFFFRFLRLVIMQAVVFGALFNVLHPWLFENLFYRLTAEVAVERTAFFIRLSLYLIFAAALALPHMLFDYAKVRMVVEDRRSAIGAVRASARFLRRQAVRVAPLYALNIALLAAVIAAYALVAPGAAGGAWVWAGFLVSQLYVGARLWARLVFWASEVPLFISAWRLPR